MSDEYERAEQREADRREARVRRYRDEDRARQHPLWPYAVRFTKEHLGPAGIERVRRLARDGGEGWHVPYHTFRGGMQFRNLLREHGFGEADFGVDNLDNIYIAITEEACGLTYGAVA